MIASVYGDFVLFQIPQRVLEIPGVEKHVVLELLPSQRSQYSGGRGEDAWDDKEPWRCGI